MKRSKLVFCLAIASLGLVATNAGAQQDAAAANSCYLPDVVRCCSVAAGATLTKECMIGDTKWFCHGRISENPLIQITKPAKRGWVFSVANGNAACKYEAPACGNSVGECGLGAVEVKTCESRRPAGPFCETPAPLLAAAAADATCDPELEICG